MDTATVWSARDPDGERRWHFSVGQQDRPVVLMVGLATRGEALRLAHLWAGHVEIVEAEREDVSA